MAARDSDSKRGKLWLNIGEAAAVAAVIIAALSFWDSHRERVDQAHREAASAHEMNLASALVLEATVGSAGRRLALSPARPDQVIESQRYVFPRPIRSAAVDVTAAAPGIDVGWIAPGLSRTLDARGEAPAGEGRLPVAIVTTYVQNGDTRQDRSIYLVGYAWKRRLLGGREISLSGIAFRGRHAAGDLQASIDAAWATTGA